MDPELGRTLIEAVATLTTIFVAYRALRGEDPRLVVARVDWPHLRHVNAHIACYVVVRVVNLSGRGNAVLGLTLQQRHAGRVIEFQQTPPPSTRSGETQRYMIPMPDGSYETWDVPSPAHERPVAIGAHGVGQIDGVFSRPELPGEVDGPPQFSEMEVVLRDSYGRRWRTAVRDLGPAAPLFLPRSSRE